MGPLLAVTTCMPRAKAAWIEAIICPSSHLDSSQRAIALAEQYPSWVFPAIGQHPSHVKDHSFNIVEYRKLAGDSRVVAIGEIGLDAHRDEAKALLEEQKTMLRSLLDLAHEVDKPVILHSRDAYQELYEILTALPYKPSGVVHCFEGSQELANKFLSLGLFVGFTGMVTYPRNEALRSVVASIPLDRMLIETDAPFLPPQVHRGEQNEPAYVVEVAKTVAVARGISADEVDRVTTENAKTLFKV